MTLPPELEKKLWTSISELERNMKMPYVTSVERLGLEKGRQEGRQEEGVFFLRRLLVKKFGDLPESFETLLTESSIADLELWGDRIVGCANFNGRIQLVIEFGMITGSKS